MIDKLERTPRTITQNLDPRQNSNTQWEQQHTQSGKPGTIRKSNQATGVRKAHYA